MLPTKVWKCPRCGGTDIHIEQQVLNKLKVLAFYPDGQPAVYSKPKRLKFMHSEGMKCSNCEAVFLNAVS